jgi:PEP-CTERM/exosortase A-associated glycosyltransferase
MRILHVFDHSLPLQSGYVTRSLGIIRAQRARGWETIHVTTPRQHSGKKTLETIDGLEFYRTPVAPVPLPVLRELFEMWATQRRLSEIVRSEKPDVIHAHSPVLNAIPALRVARRFALPIVYEVRALWEDAAVDHGTSKEGSVRYKLTRRLETWAMRRTDFVAAICEPLRQDIVARGIASDRVAIVPNAVDRALLASEASKTDESELRRHIGIKGDIVLGFIGSFYAYEGLDLLLGAANILRRREIDFTVLLVGGGPEEERLKRKVAELNLEERVRFVGRVHHSDVARYYRLVDILVFPRKRMRLTELVTPLKPLEAMAQMKTVVASDVGGHMELIRDGETGLIFPADDEAALATCLEKIIADPARRAELVQQARRYVEIERTWDSLTDRYAKIYRRVGLSS